jgi:hypothetical protein
VRELQACIGIESRQQVGEWGRGGEGRRRVRREEELNKPRNHKG